MSTSEWLYFQVISGSANPILSVNKYRSPYTILEIVLNYGDIATNTAKSLVCWNYRVLCALSPLAIRHSRSEMGFCGSRAPRVENHYFMGLDMHISDCRWYHYLQSSGIWTNSSFFLKWLKPAQTLKCWRLQRSRHLREGLREGSRLLLVVVLPYIWRPWVTSSLEMREAVAFVFMSPLRLMGNIHNFDQHPLCPKSQTYRYKTGI